MTEVDFIIVGQGVAGSCLAFELTQRQKKVAVFDDDWRDAASLVAAGVINPITGQRLVKSWRSEAAHPYAKEYYPKLEKQLDASFYHPRKILQLCKSQQERELWLQRGKQNEYKNYIGEEKNAESFGRLNDSFGSFEIERSAWVETFAACEAFKKLFLKLGILRLRKLEYGEIKFGENSVEFDGVRAQKIIFAEGWRSIYNPYFSWLPCRPAKGEILTIEADVELPEHVIHRGNWIMKCAKKRFRIGSTWDRENLDSVPTHSAREELLKAIPSIIRCDRLPTAPQNGQILTSCNDQSGEQFVVVEHRAGVRPCTATTRPHLGAHPTLKNALSFNGFGSKGFALCPYFAKQFADHLICSTPIDPEADLIRHVRKFFKQ